MTVIHHQNDRYKSDLKNNGHFGHEFSVVKSKMAVVENSRNNGRLSIKKR